LFRRHAAGKERERDTERGAEEAIGTYPAWERRPSVGLKPTTPHSAAGIRTDPPPSTPSATGQSPAQTTAADPLDEPPATLPTLYGFLVDLHTITVST
jgi:hypothetical protein